jgi:Leucine-rich repeat (LRR) protein
MNAGRVVDFTELKPEARCLVEAIAAAHDDALDAPDYLDALVDAGSRVEHGTFTRLSLHEGLALPELDLSRFRALEIVSASGVGWATRFSRVILGEQSRLTKLLIGSHGLASIDLGGCTALLDLDVSYNALTSIALPAKAPLEILNVTGNALTTLDVSRYRALARLELSQNQIAALDVGDFDELRGLFCAGNPLTHLALPNRAPLKKLSLSRCPLGFLDVSGLPLLETLFCDACNLDVLDVSSNAKLLQLSCDDNRLRRLDVAGCPSLMSLSVKGNPLASLDVQSLEGLSMLTVGDGVTVVCTEHQKRALPALRALFGIPAHASLADMDLYELDLVAGSHNWDDGVEELLAIARHPRCDLGTALAIYWNGEPEGLSHLTTADEIDDHERGVVELLRTIEQRVAADDFATKVVRFAGRATEDPRIPPAMGRRVS